MGGGAYSLASTFFPPRSANEHRLATKVVATSSGSSHPRPGHLVGPGAGGDQARQDGQGEDATSRMTSRRVLSPLAALAKEIAVHQPPLGRPGAAPTRLELVNDDHGVVPLNL